MKVFAKTDVGKVRSMNQDYFYISNPDDRIQLYIVADGMRGHKGVEIASKLAVETSKSYITNNFDLIDSMASGSTFKEISGTAMKNVPVIIPDDKTLSKFQTMCETLFSQQELLENENRNLSATRDTLLPKLMNGEIEIL